MISKMILMLFFFFSMADLFLEKMGSKSKKNVKSIAQELEKKGIDCFELIEELFSTFYFSYFSADILIHCFFVYLSEGVRVLYYMGYAFFKFYREVLISAKSLQDLRLKVKQRARSMTDSDKNTILNVKTSKISIFHQIWLFSIFGKFLIFDSFCSERRLTISKASA